MVTLEPEDDIATFLVKYSYQRFDVDRIHDALLRPRHGCSKEFAACHTLCGVIELAEVGHYPAKRRILVLIPNYNDMLFIRPLVSLALHHHGIDHRWGRFDELMTHFGTIVLFRTMVEGGRRPVFCDSIITGFVEEMIPKDVIGYLENTWVL